MTVTSHTVGEVSESRRNLPYLSRVSAQRKAEFLCLRFAPAATGGIIAYSHLHSEWQGLLLFACMLIAVTLLRRPQYPLHLVPLASAILYLLAPPLGALAAVAISLSDGTPSSVTVPNLVAPVLGADGTALGAIAVQGPTVRLPDERLPELAALLDKTTHRVAPLLA